jgi:GT2 family glycosyltransferase
MRISVIVPAFNEQRLIGETLDRTKTALEGFRRRNWETELIVCDNNSNDRTADVARAAGASLVFEPFNQIARARNRGAAAATGDWLIFLDADSHPCLDLFEEVAEHIQSGRCLAGGCTLALDGNCRKARAVTGIWNRISRALRWMAGSFIFCEAEAFRAVGGFSNELFAGEELDLSRRLKALARLQRRKVVILHRFPILTSPRKLQLYTPREYLGFLAKMVCSRGKALKDREACFAWYDGRR